MSPPHPARRYSAVRKIVPTSLAVSESHLSTATAKRGRGGQIPAGSEAGFEGAGNPCVLLLHGFPELAYCWRNQLLPLARAGFHVVAPDLRGYGLSASKAVTFDDDLLQYSMFNRVGDILGLVRALGYEQVAAVVGHDWGGPTAQWCARLRPDVREHAFSGGSRSATGHG